MCVDDASGQIAALTGLERSEWAKIRRKYLGSGINKESLDSIEQAIFHVSICLTCLLVECN